MPFSALRRLVVLLGALVLGSATLLAAPSESGHPFLQTFTPRDYRGHNQIWAAVQDEAGVMWFGTGNEVLAYDGAVWRHFPVPMPHARALGFASDGRLYVAGADALGFFAPDDDGQPVYTSLLDQLPAALRPPGVIWSMAVTPDAVFFATDRNILRWSNGHFRVWTIIEPHRQYLKFIDGELWLHRRGVGLFRFDGDEFNLISAAPALVHSRFLALIAGGAAGLRVAADGGAFFELHGAQLTPLMTPATAVLAGAQVLAGVRLPDGGCVLATIAGGVFQLNARGALVRRLDEAGGLPSQGVLSLGFDREGGIWIGTQNGVARAEFAAPWSVFDRTNGLPNAPILDLTRHDGALFVGTSAGLLRLLPSDPVTGAAAHFVSVALPRVTVWSVLSHRSGLLLAADDGVHLFDGKDPPPLILGPTTAVQRLTAARRSPDLVYLGRSEGLGRLRYEGATWHDDGMVPSPVPVITLAEAGDGGLWIGTESRGFARLIPAAPGKTWTEGRLVFFNHDHGLPDNQGNSRVLASPYGVIFLTDHGTFRFDAAADRFIADQRFLPPGMTTDSSLWPMSVAETGALWFEASPRTALEKPIGALMPASDGSFAWHQLPNKLNESVSSVGASDLETDGHNQDASVWIIGPDGAVRVAQDLSAMPAPIWSALITSVTLPNSRVLAPKLGASDVAHLPPTREPLRLTFAAPRFGAGTVEFQTRLLGYDDDWSAWSPRTEAVFTNLFGGPFTFEVRARDSDGAVSSVARWTFAVAPPLHLNPWAFALYALVLAAVVLLYVRWRLGRAERERRRLETLIAARTRDLGIARDAAESANRAKSAFLAAMSHELRTPLNGVIGYAQVLQNDHRLAPDQQEHLRIVQSSGEHLLRMINDVLDLAKIEAGKVTMRAAPCALGDLLRDIAAAHAAAAATKGLALRCELAPDLPARVECDAQKLRQVLDNLLGNAVKFTATGEIVLAVQRTADAQISFAVRDTGAGISAADQARLFQAFAQAHDARPDAPGAGLGLAISRALVGQLGGALALASVPGGGSTFSFALSLPETSASDTVDAGTRPLGFVGEPRRILIVDDHAINRRLLVDLLTPLGFICADFASPNAALDALTDGDEPWPDLAIIDIRMAGLDGLELTRAVRRLPRGPQLKVLLTSASVMSFNHEEGRSAGADDFIAKPFRASELLEKIGRLLALEWRSADPAAPLVDVRAPDPLPAAVRADLRDLLARGDLETFRAQLAVLRAEHQGPAIAALDAAAARYDLPRLRSLLN